MEIKEVEQNRDQRQTHTDVDTRSTTEVALVTNVERITNLIRNKGTVGCPQWEKLNCYTLNKLNCHTLNKLNS